MPVARNLLAFHSTAIAIWPGFLSSHERDGTHTSG
nr:MAG TPA: hypothetical protein [Caudoviricetes sp.]